MQWQNLKIKINMYFPSLLLPGYRLLQQKYFCWFYTRKRYKKLAPNSNLFSISNLSHYMHKYIKVFLKVDRNEIIEASFMVSKYWPCFISSFYDYVWFKWLLGKISLLNTTNFASRNYSTKGCYAYTIPEDAIRLVFQKDPTLSHCANWTTLK